MPPRQKPRTSAEPAPGGRVGITASRFWRLMPAGMSRGWWRVRAFDLLARCQPVQRRRGVLVLRPEGLAEAVLFRPALDRYAAIFGVSREEITVLVSDRRRDLAETVLSGYRLVAIDPEAFERRLWYRLRTALRIRALAPLVTVNDAYFRRALVNDSLAWIVGAPRTVASLPYIAERARAEFTYYLSQVEEVIDTGLYPTHDILRHFRLVSALAGREIRPKVQHLPWPRVPTGTGAGPYIALAFDEAAETGGWLAAHGAGFAKRARAAGYRLVAADGSADILGVLTHAAAVVAGDDGLGHLSIALGTPTVMVTGGGRFGCRGPYPVGAAPAHTRFVFHRMACYHCFWNCRMRIREDEVYPCLAGVEAAAVWQAVEELLEVEAPAEAASAGP